MGNNAITFIREIAIMAAILIMLAVLAACNGSQDSKITIKVPLTGEKEKASPLALDRLDQWDNVFCSAWVSEQEVTCVSNGRASEAKMVIRNLQTGETTQTKIGADASLQISPDRKHAFVLHGYWAEMAALGSFDTNPISLTIGDAYTSWINREAHGSWIDDKTYILPIVDRKFATIDIDGKVAYSVLEGKQESIHKLVTKNDLLYTLDESRQLQVFAKGNSEPRLLRNHVVSFDLSPDGKQLAYAVQNAPNQESLLIMNIQNGTEEKFIAKGRLLRQLSWSPDGRKLAFAVLSMDQGMTGLYAMQAQTGGLTPLSNHTNLESPIVWSPSGDQLMVSEGVPGDRQSNVFTTIYRLKTYQP